MASPTRSRSPSAAFAPGPHRRSHPNLHHLSLAPLTPKYPIDPADYDAYFNPSTTELHTSTSLSQIASLPSPGGILTNSPVRSRASSRVRRKVKSTVAIREPHGALTSEGFEHQNDAEASHVPKKPSSLKLQTDSSWLIQTGLTLTEGSRESKGQSWITKRESSTSLHISDDQRPRSGRATPVRSRSRKRSKKDLSMTPAISAVHSPGEEVVPDWADVHTQAVIAAQVENDLAEEQDFADGDPYGMLNFEEQYESDDEEEVRQALSRYKLGRWMDGIVDTFLKLEELEAADQTTEESSTSKKATGENDSASVNGSDIEPPPQRPKGLWDDVAWFGRLVGRAVWS